MSIRWNQRKYTEQEFREAWAESKTIQAVAIKLGLNRVGSQNSLKNTAKTLNLNRDHMTGYTKQKDGSYTHSKKIPTSDILVENSTYNGPDLRLRLLKEGIFEIKCSAPYCPNPEEYPNPFTGEMVPQKLTLDHINGVNTDNRIENLRILCYNCHALTDTFCGKNKEGAKNNPTSTICNCGSIKTRLAVSCSNCNKIKLNKDRIMSKYSDEYLKESLSKMSKNSFAKSIGVAPRTVSMEIELRGITI